MLTPPRPVRNEVSPICRRFLRRGHVGTGVEPAREPLTGLRVRWKVWSFSSNPSLRGSFAMPQRIVQVDAFADRPFVGNPAAVCVLNGPRADSWMQDVAREMNLSETAFLVRGGGGIPPPLVHADGRGQPLRPCHAGLGARPLGGRPPAVRHSRDLPDPERHALGDEGSTAGSPSTSRPRRSRGRSTPGRSPVHSGVPVDRPPG